MLSENQNNSCLCSRQSLRTESIEIAFYCIDWRVLIKNLDVVDLETISPQEIEDLQKAADFHLVRKSRMTGIGSIVFG